MHSDAGVQVEPRRRDVAVGDSTNHHHPTIDAATVAAATATATAIVATTTTTTGIVVVATAATLTSTTPMPTSMPMPTPTPPPALSPVVFYPSVGRTMRGATLAS